MTTRPRDSATGALEPERLRVLLLSDAVPGRNGVGTYYDDLMEHLRPRVARIQLLAPPPPGESGEIPGRHIPMPGDPTQSLFIPSLRAVGEAATALRPHVIVAGSPWILGWSGPWLARRLDAGLCVGYHTQFERIAALYWPRGLSRLSGPFLRWWDRLFLRFADTVVVLNRALEADARRGGCRRVEVMGTPSPKAFLRRPAPPPPKAIRSLLFLGRLAPEKRVLQVLEAAADHPDLRVRIVGDGPLRSAVDEAAAALPSVETVPWVERDQVLEYLDAADLVLLPSRFETFGSAAYEGMLRRRAVLASPTCGFLSWPRLREGAFVTDPGETVSDAVSRLLQLDATVLARVATAGYEGARTLSRDAVDHWVAVLCDAARGRS